MTNILKNKFMAWLPVVLLAVPLLIFGCLSSGGQSVTDASIARDAMLDYLNRQYSDNVPAQNLTWLEEDKTPSGLLGSAVKSYKSDGWTMLISYPVVRPDLTVYTATLVNNNTGWMWEGTIDVNGAVKETRPLKQISQEESLRVAEMFVKVSPTFSFDGREDTLKLVSVDTLRTPFAWQFTFEFQSRQAGYGDRTGQIMAQVITPHTAEITVIRARITRATIDGQWDMLKQKIISGEISEEASLQTK